MAAPNCHIIMQLAMAGKEELFHLTSLVHVNV